LYADNLFFYSKLEAAKSATTLLWHANCMSFEMPVCSGVVFEKLKKKSLFFGKQKIMEAVTATNTASSIQMDYIKILVTQLQNQNPLEPIDNNDMTSQLAQLSSLQQLESINSNFGTMNSDFAKMLAASNRNYATSLLGKDVSYLSTDNLTGLTKKEMGTVGEVYDDPGGDSVLVVDQQALALEEIANSLTGMEVLYRASVGGVTEFVRGTVNGVNSDDSGEKFLVVDGNAVSFESLVPESLIGRQVSFYVTDESTGISESKTSVVTGVSDGSDGKNLFVTGRLIALGDVVSVKN